MCVESFTQGHPIGPYSIPKALVLTELLLLPGRWSLQDPARLAALVSARCMGRAICVRVCVELRLRSLLHMLKAPNDAYLPRV